MADAKHMRCTGKGCRVHLSCPWFNSTATIEFSPPTDEKCELYQGDAEVPVSFLGLKAEKEIEILLIEQRELKRRLKEISCQAIAERYNTSYDTIYRIRRACRL